METTTKEKTRYKITSCRGCGGHKIYVVVAINSDGDYIHLEEFPTLEEAENWVRWS